MIKRNMSLIISNQFFTNMADSIFNLAILWYVYQITESALFASVVTAITFISQIIAAPLIGVLIDRFEPKSSMQIGYGLMISTGFILFASYMLWIDTLLFFIYLCLVIQTICMNFIHPAKSKLLPRIVGEKRIVQVNGYITSTSQTASLIGQASSGILIGLIGFAGVMLTHSGIYILASILLLFVINIKVNGGMSEKIGKTSDETAATTEEKLGFWGEFKEGATYLKSRKSLLKLALFSMALNVSTISGSLIVVLVADRYSATAEQFGWINAAGAVVGILLGLIAKKITTFAKPNQVFGYMVLLAGISTLLMGLATNIWFGTLFFMMSTASSVILNITFSSLLILEIEDQYRGRVFSLINLFSVFLMPPLAIIGGITADLFSVEHLFYFTGIYLAVIALYPLIDKDLKTLAKLPS